MSKRGQAALEFLTTYGWAFLIIMVMIGAISYFGILNPSKFVPARCTVSPEFSCQDYRIVGSAGRVDIVLKQSIGKTITFNRIDCKYSTATSTSFTPVAGAWSPTAAQTTSCTFNPNVLSTMTGQKVKITYDITYQKSTGGLTQIASGEVFAEVQ